MGGLNHVLNLVLLSLNTIENDLLCCVLFPICLRSYSIFNEKIILYIFILTLIWYVKLVQPTATFIVVFLTAKINDYKLVLFCQATLRNSLISSLSIIIIIPGQFIKLGK